MAPTAYGRLLEQRQAVTERRDPEHDQGNEDDEQQYRHETPLPYDPNVITNATSAGKSPKSAAQSVGDAE
jgi:hypothetical protein